MTRSSSLVTQCYSFQSRDQIFLKGYGFLSFAKNMDKTIVKNITKILSGKYSQKRLDYTQQSATDALKTSSKRVIQTGNLIGNKTVNKITKV